MKNPNANFKKVDTMLLKKLKKLPINKDKNANEKIASQAKKFVISFTCSSISF